MTSRPFVLAATFLIVATRALHAQHAGNAPSDPTRAPQEAHQYDFLLGEWTVEAKPLVNSLAAKIHGVPKLVGTWRAWRALDGWGLADEIKLLDASGNPRNVAHALRVVDASGHWKQVTVDAYRGAVTQSDGTWDGAAMVITGSGTDDNGKAYRSRIRFSDITPTSFTYRIDRSWDLGKTWSEGVLTITAKRSAATATR
jgi:hypothetical protein